MPTKVADGVFLIDTLAAGLPGRMASYFIKGEQSVLVDSGYPSSAETVLSELRALNGNDLVDYLIPTHVHLDHAGAVGHLARTIPGVQILVNEHGAKHLVDPSRLVQSATDVFGEEAMRAYGSPVPVLPEQVQAVRGPRVLDLGSKMRLRLFWTPGHAWHHMSAFLENERLLFTGDAVGLHYPGFDFPIPATPPPGFDADRYEETLRVFMGINPAVLLLPHFGPVRDNVQSFLQNNLETVSRWVSASLEIVKSGRPLDQVFELFIADVAVRSGRPRAAIPDNMSRIIMHTARGCYAYAQETEKAAPDQRISHS